MYSDEEDNQVRVYGGNNNDLLLEDWMRSNTRVSVTDGANSTMLENDGEPWSVPGASISDYFNFGFTKESWQQFLYGQITKRQDKIAEEEEKRKRPKHPHSPDLHHRRKGDTRPEHSDY